MNTVRFLAALAALTLALVGCTTDGVLFVTKTGVAVDLDTTPPALDIGYLRQEGVFAHVFDHVPASDSTTSRPLVHPVLTTVGADAKGFGIEMDHSFATGAAAMVFADYLANPAEYPLGAADRVPRPAMDGALMTRKGGRRIPYFFGTDTSVGLGVTWATNWVPRSISIGYKRKELAIVPLRKQTCWYLVLTDTILTPGQVAEMRSQKTMIPVKYNGQVRSYNVDQLITAGLLAEYEFSRLPSLIATAQAGVGVENDAKKTGIVVSQAFATGAAATLLAKHGEVRRVLGPALVPNFDEVVRMRGRLVQGGANLAFASDLFHLLKRIAETNTPGAQDIVDALNRIPREFGFRRFTRYLAFVPRDRETPAKLGYDADAGAVALPTDFEGILAYKSELDDSVEKLEKAGVAHELKAGLQLFTDDPSVATTADETRAARVRADLAEQGELKQRLEAMLSRHPAFNGMIEILCGRVRKGS